MHQFDLFYLCFFCHYGFKFTKFKLTDKCVIETLFALVEHVSHFPESLYLDLHLF